MKSSPILYTAISAILLLPSITTGADWQSSESTITVDQGWDYADRSFFYFSPQGSPIIPFDIASALEQPSNENMFMDPDFLTSLGMIYWQDEASNPENLPVGLTVDEGRLGDKKYLGMNCSACHVTEIKVGGKTALVDGGVSHFDFWSFMRSLNHSLQNTYSDKVKFDRFTKRLTSDHRETDPVSIRADLRKAMRDIEDWSYRNNASVEPGPGRVDALNVILNQVTAKMIHEPGNARPADAPVSYPFLWDAPYFDVVQYNGAVPNAGAGALGRNIGQVLGVFGRVDIAEGTLPVGYNSSVNVSHLMGLEEKLETLKSPLWSDFADQGLLPALNGDLVSKGRSVYEDNCESCHASFDRDNRGDLAATKLKLLDLPTIGTDPAAALGFSARRVKTGALKGRKIGVVGGDPFCEVSHGNAVLAHMVTAVMLNNYSDDKHILKKSALQIVETSIHSKISHLGKSIRSFFGFDTEGSEHTPDYVTVVKNLSDKGYTREKIIKELDRISDDKSILFDELVADTLDFQGDDQACMATVETAQYRARPLNGVWATGPFLHNGSVKSLEELLKPTPERAKSFVVGNGDFDPVAIGFEPDSEGNGFIFDTSVPGNSNAGHEYGTKLSATDKAALLEYLKSL